jgi:cytochrome P450
VGKPPVNLVRCEYRRDGLHYCVGATLARIEARAVLKTVLAQTHHFALDHESARQWVDSLLVPLTATAR